MATYKKELARELDQKIDYVVVDNYERVLFQTDSIEKARRAIIDTDDIIVYEGVKGLTLEELASIQEKENAD
jgi:molecular chaperone GrpE (heat shock protein)